MPLLSNDLKQERASTIAQMEALNDLAAKRAFTGDEQIQFDKLSGELGETDKPKEGTLNYRIAKAVSNEARMMEIAEQKTKTNPAEVLVPADHGVLGQSERREVEKIKDRYNLGRILCAGLGMQSKKYNLSGPELEMHQQGQEEALSNGTEIQGIAIPSILFNRLSKGNRLEQRQNIVGTDADGGFTVQTDVRQITDALWPNLKVVSLGAQEWTGLKGNIQMPTNDNLITSGWKGEVAESDVVKPTFIGPTITPHRLPTALNFSKQLMIQSIENPSIEAWFADTIRRGIRTDVDFAAISGSGTGDVPEGILSLTNLQVHAMGTDGLVIDHNSVLELERLIATADADDGSLAYLTTPGVRKDAKMTFVDTGSGRPLWQDTAVIPMFPGGSGAINGEGFMNGYRAAVSNQVPDDLTKGSSSGVAHAAIFANWNDWVIANWGGIDILVNPYSLDTQGLIRLTTSTYWDFHAMHEASFAAVLDYLVA